MALQFDTVGEWSEIKLDILKQYAQAYSTIMSKRKHLFHVYIDAFAGAGMHISKKTSTFIPGSPLNALVISPPFREYHLIDLDGARVANLQKLTVGHPDVQIYQGDSNDILIKKVLPNVRYDQFRRGLCLLDPYGLHLDWTVIQMAGQLGSIDMFLNFPIMDMNRNVFWQNPSSVDVSDIARMNSFWGDASWQTAAYASHTTLIGSINRKTSNPVIAEAFRDRLRRVAGFKFVPEPLPMKNSRGSTMYYLFFASQRPVAQHIIDAIFQKYQTPRMASLFE